MVPNQSQQNKGLVDKWLHLVYEWYIHSLVMEDSSEGSWVILDRIKGKNGLVDIVDWFVDFDSLRKIHLELGDLSAMMSGRVEMGVEVIESDIRFDESKIL